MEKVELEIWTTLIGGGRRRDSGSGAKPGPQTSPFVPWESPKATLPPTAQRLLECSWKKDWVICLCAETTDFDMAGMSP